MPQATFSDMDLDSSCARLLMIVRRSSPFTIESVDPLLLKENLDAVRFQFPDCCQAVNSIPCETTH